MNLRSRLGIFVLTAEEQRTIAFIVLALVLGLATQHYRHLHSQPKPGSNAESTPANLPSKSAAPLLREQALDSD